MSIDTNTERRRAEFGLGSTMENEHRVNQRIAKLAVWLVILIIGVGTVAIGTSHVWLP